MTEEEINKRREELFDYFGAARFTTMENLTSIFVIVAIIFFHLLVTLSFYI